MRCEGRADGRDAADGEGGEELLVVTADSSFSNDVLWADAADAETAAAEAAAVEQPTGGAGDGSSGAGGSAWQRGLNSRGPPPPPPPDPRGVAVAEVVLSPRGQAPPAARRGGGGESGGGGEGGSYTRVAAEEEKPGEKPPAPPSVRAHGVLSNGQPFDSALSGEHDEWVGRRAGAWWCKARLPDGRLLLSRGKGFDVTNAVVDEAEARRRWGRP